MSDDTETNTDKNDYREYSKWDAVLNPDLLTENTAEGQAHPTPEQLFIREAIKKALMNSQKELWAMYAYDQMTYAEIGRKLKKSPVTIKGRITTIERQIAKWCKAHIGVYQALKEAEGYDETLDR